ncbi:hypothetical protein H257_02511 [Aphanomyces astaci]|uniref:tRNA:m(4)X modification enzyme TRM13 n=1 Tax=Aphanomyces astaci TaxID=112090 RepID=W4H4G0_APHAT|nr:hypothetical protein H257_02511 [Aphanomyces astaci]ETV86023.1 hypothetical protein H257_02511 [Aphanomyces astaci]|eukprot:XP_009824495.1 hypothetical protein H257_02511 [Aphanomyces astaci]
MSTKEAADAALTKPPHVSERLKRKREKAKAMKDGEWTQCMFKLERKNRFCNVARVEGSLYCGNHVVDDEGVVSQKTKKYKQELCKRVPCTLDPTHTVYLFDLKKHLVICNKLKEAEVMRSLPFYTANINSGTHAATGTSDPSTTVQDDTSATEEHSGPSSDKQASLFQTLVGLDFNAFAAKIDAAFDKHVPVIPTQTLDHAACNTLLQQKQAAGANHSILRHIQQQASILGHMESKRLLRSDCVYVELGAGRAMLSLALTQMYPSSPFVLIDRAGSRGKADQYIALDNKCTRAKIDIRHLNLAKMDQVAHQPLVCLSKHLCGVATDLSLRALANTLPAGPSDDATEAPTGHPQKMSSHLVGLAIALCCHHACSWEDYVNPAFFVDMGFTAAEFKLMVPLSGWATCGMTMDGGAVETVLGFNRADRTRMGRQCKRLLDMGRVHYLRERGVQAQLVHYCDQDESLENCLLLAWRSHHDDVE